MTRDISYDIKYQALCKLTAYVLPHEKKKFIDLCAKKGIKQSALLCDAVRFYFKNLENKTL